MVYNILRENIMSGYLKPGTRLVLKVIAGELGVSEIPVREAIRMLEAQGLVTITPHAGARVSSLLSADVEEMFSIRSVLEGYATKLATPHISPGLMQELESCLLEMEKCIEEKDYAALGLLNRQFHCKIYAASPNMLLSRMISDLWDSSERSKAIFYLSKDRPRQSLQEHREILSAIKAGDGDRAEVLVREQKLRTREVMVEYLRSIEQKENKKQN